MNNSQGFTSTHRYRARPRREVAAVFEEMNTEITFPSWLLQQILALVGPLLAFGVPGAILNIPDTVPFQILGYVIIGSISVALAVLVSALAPASSRAGSFVWLLPTTIELAAIVYDLIPPRVDPISGFFLVPSGKGEEMWGMIVFTWPTWSCCCYSALAWWRLRNTRGRHTTTRENIAASK